MTPEMTLTEAMALADQDCPLPVLAGRALRLMRNRIRALEAVGKVVVTRNEAGVIVAVTRQDDDGEILSVIAESAAQQPVAQPENAMAVLGYIRDAKRFDREQFADDSAFADWAQSWARHATQVEPLKARSAQPEPASASADAEDAARYRWLRSLDGSCDAAACVNFNIGFDWIEQHGDELDAAIDRAREGDHAS